MQFDALNNLQWLEFNRNVIQPPIYPYRCHNCYYRLGIQWLKFLVALNLIYWLGRRKKKRSKIKIKIEAYHGNKMFSTFGKDSFHNVFILFKMRTTTCIFDSFFLLISYQKSNNNYLAKTCLQWRFDGQRRDIVLVIDIWFLDGFREPLQSKNLKVLLVHNIVLGKETKRNKQKETHRKNTNKI